MSNGGLLTPKRTSEVAAGCHHYHLGEQSLDHITFGDSRWAWQSRIVGCLGIQAQGVIDRRSEIGRRVRLRCWSRSVGIGRADDGATFVYASRIDHTRQMPVEVEGPCEPSLVLLAVMQWCCF